MRPRKLSYEAVVARVRVADERGVALVMALGILVVCTIMVTTVIAYTSSGQRTSYSGKVRLTAFDAADAGMNNAFAVLNLPTNNSLDPSILPPCHTANPDTTTPGSTNSTWFSSPGNLTARSTWNQNLYGKATVYWCGDFDRYGAQWFLRSIGSIRNTSIQNSGTTNRMLTSRVTVQPTLTQPKNNPVWDYLYAGHIGSACDQSLNNNISGASRMYVAGNLCLSPNVQLAQSTVIVGGNLDLSNNAAVGANTSMSTRVETYVGGNCRYGSNGPPWIACSGNQDWQRIYSKLSDGTTIAVNHTAPIIAPPTADFAGWYQNAIPGPAQSCTTASGTTPAFDTNYPTRDNSVPAVFDLTPSTSYTCRVGRGASTTLGAAITSSQTSITVASAAGFPTSGNFRIRIDDEAMTVTGGQGTTTWTVTRAANGTTAASHVSSQTVEQDDAGTSGELSWNATTKTLTVSGTIFIDGSAKVSNGALNMYNGQATLYLSGTFYANGSLCGATSGTNCNFAGWNPDKELLMIVANGNGGQINPGDSIYIANNFSFEGGLYATNAVEFGNNVNVDGPIVGSQIVLSNNLTTNAFPSITTVPVGMPSNNEVYAQPNPPQSFSG
jgi:Tfp pilus assembly protein PilX